MLKRGVPPSFLCPPNPRPRPTIRVLDISPLAAHHHVFPKISHSFLQPTRSPCSWRILYTAQHLSQSLTTPHLPRRQAASQDLQGSISQATSALRRATECSRAPRSTYSAILCYPDTRTRPAFEPSTRRRTGSKATHLSRAYRHYHQQSRTTTFNVCDLFAAPHPSGCLPRSDDCLTPSAPVKSHKANVRHIPSSRYLQQYQQT